MTWRSTPRLAAVFTAIGLCAGSAAAQTTQPATQPTTAPAQRTPLTARVLEVRGDVQHAVLDGNEWQPCQANDEYPEQTVIRTGVRSSVKLQIGADDTYTALVIEPASKTVISEAYRTADTKRVRIGVGYGQMRAGVAEGGLKSDFTVDSPVATLSKRGTWDFGLFYERDTDRFEIFLLDRGLVDAFSKATGARRELLPAEFATQVMRRWLDESQILRNVAIVDLLGQPNTEVAFNRLQQDGLRVLDPNGGQVVLVDLSNSFAQQQFLNLARTVIPVAGQTGLTPARPEGFFGTGRGDDLIPLVIEANSPLSQKGFAQPGRYMFRRSALEGWLAKHGR